MSKELTIQKELNPALSEAKKITIKNEKTLSEAITFRQKLKAMLAKFTAERKKRTDKLKEQIKIIDLDYRPYEKMIEEALDDINTKATAYQTEQKRIADEKAEAIESRIGEGKGHLKPETAIEQISNLEKPASRVATESGTIRFKTVQKFEVMDMTMLPLNFHLANEQAIRKTMLEGEHLPGVRYYTEEVPITTR